MASSDNDPAFPIPQDVAHRRALREVDGRDEEQYLARPGRCPDCAAAIGSVVMRLESHYVQSSDGRWWHEPIVRGPGWFVCWDDDDPIELVVREEHEPADVVSALQRAGWPVAIDAEDECCGMRMFGGERWFEDARSFWLTQESGPPADLLEQTREVHRSDIVQGVMFPNGRIGAVREPLKPFG